LHRKGKYLVSGYRYRTSRKRFPGKTAVTSSCLISVFRRAGDLQGKNNRPLIEDFLQFIEFQGTSLQIPALFCRFKMLIDIQMKKGKNLLYLCVLCVLISTIYSCKAQYGCPSNGKNVGAERILAGEKLPKPPKFNP
jgi:hypothetical protein